MEYTNPTSQTDTGVNNVRDIQSRAQETLEQAGRRWNDAVPPSGPPFNCSATLSCTPVYGNGVPSRVSWSSVKPNVDRKQPLQLIVETRPAPP